MFRAFLIQVLSVMVSPDLGLLVKMSVFPRMHVDIQNVGVIYFPFPMLKLKGLCNVLRFQLLGCVGPRGGFRMLS